MVSKKYMGFVFLTLKDILQTLSVEFRNIDLENPDFILSTIREIRTANTLSDKKRWDKH